MGRRTLVIGLCLAVCAAMAGAVELEVTYVEGLLEVQSGGKWVELMIGDVVDSEENVRYDGDGLAELTGAGMDVTLREAGVYRLSDIVSQSKEVSSWGFGSLVKTRMSGILHGTQKTESAVMGVRASEAAGEKEEVSWLGSSEELVKEGKQAIEDGNFDEALEIFQEAYEFCEEEEESGLLFYLGYTRLLMGQRGLALESFSEVDMDSEDDLYGDYTVLKGQLLMESLAFEEALDVFSEYTDLVEEGETLQLVHLLSGYSENAMGESSRAKSSLQKAVNLGPTTEYGREASALLGKIKG